MRFPEDSYINRFLPSFYLQIQDQDSYHTSILSYVVSNLPFLILYMLLFDLFLQILLSGVRRTNPLLPNESRTSQQEDPLLVPCGSPMFLYPEGVHQREDVRVQSAVPYGELLVLQNRVSPVRPILFRFGAVKPECI